jgi:protein-tyrosine phosphatase
LTSLNRSRYLLVEFPPGYVSPGAAGTFHELVIMDRVPVIAHPERNLVFARDLGKLAALVEKGALAQVTAGSLTGDFGRSARTAAFEMLRGGLAHLVASDAHSPEQRPPRMAAAREAVRKELGAEAEERLFVKNPEAVVRSEPVE